MSQILPQSLTTAGLPRSADRILKAGEAMVMFRNALEGSYVLQSILDPDDLGLTHDRDGIHEAAQAHHEGRVDQAIAARAATSLRRMEMRAEAVAAAFDFLPRPNPDRDTMVEIKGVLRALVSAWSHAAAPSVTPEERRAMLDGRDPFPLPALDEEYGSEPGLG